MAKCVVVGRPRYRGRGAQCRERVRVREDCQRAVSTFPRQCEAVSWGARLARRRKNDVCSRDRGGGRRSTNLIDGGANGCVCRRGFRSCEEVVQSKAGLLSHLIEVGKSGASVRCGGERKGKERAKKEATRKAATEAAGACQSVGADSSTGLGRRCRRLRRCFSCCQPHILAYLRPVSALFLRCGLSSQPLCSDTLFRAHITKSRWAGISLDRACSTPHDQGSRLPITSSGQRDITVEQGAFVILAGENLKKTGETMTDDDDEAALILCISDKPSTQRPGCP